MLNDKLIQKVMIVAITLISVSIIVIGSTGDSANASTVSHYANSVILMDKPPYKFIHVKKSWLSINKYLAKEMVTKLGINHVKRQIHDLVSHGLRL
ncbi:hypothetical protein [Acetilactobacillus jinshanensis]|uniref:Uncharacterized protein n=1 Tax=Acetilactobacillus jinshanensis TaxID=1720083 RepID=A0A4P6ZP67_9LACO|nr:hypothetical protein [Acetilactobacillus jinshanensis]QBP18940.1 hypothetical protein ELX58_07580 [Acetilactobacillus jinshanensis]URL60510.1 hypothetical protein HGK75_00215 [uncultured bacterium]